MAITAACLFFLIPQVYSQETEDQDTVPSLSLYIPDKMISGLHYEGMVFLSSPEPDGITVSMAADSRSVTVPSSVTIPPGKNHAIFPISFPGPQTDDQITIHAVAFGGVSASTSSYVYSVASRATSLVISAPLVFENPTDGVLVTSADLAPIKIILADDHGIPIIADKNMPVTITSSAPGVKIAAGSDTTFSDSLKINIRNGTYSSDVTISVTGDATIYATSEGMESGMLDVAYDPNELQVMIGIAPNPAPANSLIYYDVWLEREGIQQIPDETLDVYLTSSSSCHIEFDITERGVYCYTDSEPVHTYMINGIASGSAYTGLSGVDFSVTASVPGIGIGTAEIEVVDLRAERVASYIVSKTEDISTTQILTELTANKLMAWVHPTIPVGDARVIIGKYIDLDVDELIEKYDGNTTIGEEPPSHLDRSEPFPLPYDDVPVSVSPSDGIRILDNTESEIEVARPGGAAIPIKVLTDRSHTISVASSETEGYTATIDSNSGAGRQMSVVVTPIPSIAGIHGDIAFASLVDGETNTISEHGDDDINLDISQAIQSGDSIKDLELDDRWVGGTATISGMHVKDGGRLHVQIPGTISDPTGVEASTTPAAIDLWFPGMVNTNSEFPSAIHVVNGDGIPIGLITDPDGIVINSEYASVVGADPIRFAVENDGEHSITIINGDQYVGTGTFQSQSNPVGDEIRAESISPNIMRLGSEVLLDIFTGNIEDPTIDISGLDFEQLESGEYLATPKEEGTYEVTVVVDGAGWEQYTKQFQFNVEDLVDVNFQTITDDNVSLPISIKIHDPNTEEEEFTEIHNGFLESLPPGIYEIELDPRYESSSDRIYVLRGLAINGESVPYDNLFSRNLSENSVISASYQREIEVNFESILDSDIEGVVEGNGAYRYGDTVRIYAIPAQELFGLVWHVPTSWEGLPADAIVDGDTARFEALTSVQGYVVYEQNYLAVIALIVAGTGIPSFIVAKKSPESILNLKDSILGLKDKFSKMSVRKKK